MLLRSAKRDLYGDRLPGKLETRGSQLRQRPPPAPPSCPPPCPTLLWVQTASLQVTQMLQRRKVPLFPQKRSVLPRMLGGGNARFSRMPSKDSIAGVGSPGRRDKHRQSDVSGAPEIRRRQLTRLFLRTTLVIGGSFQSTLKNCQALALVLKKHGGEIRGPGRKSTRSRVT